MILMDDLQGNSLTAVFAPMIVEVCLNAHKFTEPVLRASAVLALCKLMCTNAEFCEGNLRLLFTVGFLQLQVDFMTINDGHL